MCSKFILAVFVAVVATATADDVAAPFPVVKTTITGESGTITDERPLPVAPVVPYVYGSRVLPYVYPPTVKIVPEVKKVKSSEDDSDTVEVESEPATLPPPFVLPHFGYYPTFPGYYPSYPGYILNGGNYFYRYLF